jgi:hypothetical protein
MDDEQNSYDRFITILAQVLNDIIAEEREEE